VSHSHSGRDPQSWYCSHPSFGNRLLLSAHITVLKHRIHAFEHWLVLGALGGDDKNERFSFAEWIQLPDLSRRSSRRRIIDACHLSQFVGERLLDYEFQ
jgi:hypothetical protein